LFGPAFNHLRRVYAIRRDRSGNLWFGHGNFGGIGTPNAGVSFLRASEVDAGTPQFKSYSTANGLPHNAVISISDGIHGIWLGAPGGGVWRLGGPGEASGWPKSLSSFPHYSSPLLVDLDHDRDLEVVVGDHGGNITAFQPDGTTLWAYDTRNAFPAGRAGNPVIQSSPAAGDVDGDGEIEILVGVGGFSSNGSAPSGGGVVILSRTGQLERLITTSDITGPSTATSDGLADGVFATPALANVDDDPEPEIVFGAFDGMLYAVNYDSTPVNQRNASAGWPQN
jgi:hypothetical protein